MASTAFRTSFSILPSHQNPLLSSLTLSPHSQIHRKRLSIVSHRRTRRRPRRKLAGGKDMSVAVTMPAPSHGRDKSLDSFSDSTNSAGEGELLTADVEGEMSSTRKNAMRKSKYLISRICFGVELSPDNIAVAMVYFVQGVLGLARLAVSFYLKDDLHLEPAEVMTGLVIHQQVMTGLVIHQCPSF